mmetsp:Transcript_174098/g.558213  ORF Transcript_174098/g.558213 Transcript_174098/m.558213 type:complete len:438 (-) Transcript_174098:286-1599(-)
MPGFKSEGMAPAIDLPELRKTRMCMHNVRGKCKRGDACMFAHNAEELVSAPDLRKTKLCAHFIRGERCWKGGCRFAHSEQELRPVPGFYKARLCVFFHGEGCKQEETCRFAHSQEEVLEARQAFSLSGHDASPASHAGASADGGGHAPFFRSSAIGQAVSAASPSTAATAAAGLVGGAAPRCQPAGGATQATAVAAAALPRGMAGLAAVPIMRHAPVPGGIVGQKLVSQRSLRAYAQHHSVRTVSGGSPPEGGFSGSTKWDNQHGYNFSDTTSDNDHTHFARVRGSPCISRVQESCYDPLSQSCPQQPAVHGGPLRAPFGYNMAPPVAEFDCTAREGRTAVVQADSQSWPQAMIARPQATDVTVPGPFPAHASASVCGTCGDCSSGSSRGTNVFEDDFVKTQIQELKMMMSALVEKDARPEIFEVHPRPPAGAIDYN